MNRIDRVVLLVSYFISFAIVFALGAAFGLSAGPIEMVIVLVLAIPLCALVVKILRSLLGRGGRQAPGSS